MFHREARDGGRGTRGRGRRANPSLPNRPACVTNLLQTIDRRLMQERAGQDTFLARSKARQSSTLTGNTQEHDLMRNEKATSVAGHRRLCLCPAGLTVAALMCLFSLSFFGSGIAAAQDGQAAT